MSEEMNLDNEMDLGEDLGMDMDKAFGVDADKEQEAEIVPVPKRRPYYVWEVNGRSYKLTLTTAIICKLEEQFKQNLLNVVSKDGIPPLRVMLMIVHGAMLQYQHGINGKHVQALYDKYLEEGGNQLQFYTDVVMGTMSASGFFTDNQAENLENKLEMTDELM